MAKAWKSHVDYACPSCGNLLVVCEEAINQTDRTCLTCGEPVKLIGIGTATVGNARWFRCTSCDQLHMLRRGEFVKTGERSGSIEFGSAPTRRA